VQEFHVSRDVCDLKLTVFLVGFVVGRSSWGLGSKLTGRRPISIYTFALCTPFYIGQVRANSMTTPLMTRFLCGFFGSAPLTNSMGVIADIWDPVNLGIRLATSLSIASSFLDPATGPAVGIL
jgi:DHA1 family multidrug resistance protein-like MFS transporter